MSSLKTLRKVLYVIVGVLGLLLLRLIFFGATWAYECIIILGDTLSPIDMGVVIEAAILLVLMVVFGVDIAIISCVISDSKLW